MKSFINFLKKTLIPSLVISSLVLVVVSPLGCRATIEGIHLLEGDFTVPKITEVEVSNARSITITCSKNASIKNASLKCLSQEEEAQPLEKSQSDEKKRITLVFPKETEIGLDYVLKGSLEDENGNSLLFRIPFTGFNERIPRLIFSEVRNASDSKKMKHEYVEFYALTDGNLAGLEFVSAYDGEEKKYSFPPIEVTSGQFITLHLRKPQNEEGKDAEEGMIDETGENLNLAFATDSCPTARDLWVENTSARIAPSDILILRNSANGKLLDVLLFAETKTSAWNKKYASYEELVEESGIWHNRQGNATCSIESALCSDSMTTVTRSFSRQNISSLVVDSYSVSADDWLLVGSKGGKTNECSPGLPNSSQALPK